MPRYRKIKIHLDNLESGGKEARRFAARKLGRPGNTAAVAQLCQALRDEDRHVRGNAAKALGRIGDPEAVEPLCKLIERDFALGVRRKAIIALGEIGDPASVPMLCRVVATGKHGLEENALASLMETGLPAIVALCQTLDLEEPTLATGAKSALVRMCYHVRRREEATLSTILQEIVRSPDLAPIQQARALETLRVHRPRFWLPDPFGGDVARYCERILARETDASVRKNAQAILDYLSLGRAGDRNVAQERDSLLRGILTTPSSGGQDWLLRASSASHSSSPRRGVWRKSLVAFRNRWFRRTR